MMDFLKMTRNFKLFEQRVQPTIASYIQALGEHLDAFSPKNISDSRRLEIAKENLHHIKKYVRHLQEQISILEEEINILKENEKR